MEITQFITETSKGQVPLATLTTIAADRRAHGDDVLTAFRTQIEQRTAAAQKVLDDAQTAGRDSLLASEQRSYDAAIRERDSILGLQRNVEARTEQMAHVPATQVPATETTSADLSPVLTRDSKVSDWLQKRGGYAYQGERGAESMRLGRIVRALAVGDRRGLSALEQRALAEGTDSSGGYTVPEVLASSFIDRVRAATVVMRAGAVTVPMSSDNLSIARVVQPDAVSPGAALASWRSENESIQETDLLLERVTFTARTLAVMLKLSVELAEDSVNIDTIIERELSRQMALELDRVLLFGSGTAPEPRGLTNQSGVNTEDFGGAAVTDYDFFVDSIGRVMAYNHTPSARLYNTSLHTALGKLKDTTGQPLRAPEMVTAVPAFITNQIPATGGSPASTQAIVGDFSNLMLGLRSSFRLEVTRVAGTSFEKLQVWVRAFLRADVQLARPEAFDIVDNLG